MAMLTLFRSDDSALIVRRVVVPHTGETHLTPHLLVTLLLYTLYTVERAALCMRLMRPTV